MRSKPTTPLRVSPEVERALRAGRPIVGIESAIISPGGAYPGNVELLRSVCDVLNKRGATPAIIAAVNGRLHVGLSEDDVERFARAERVIKVGRRDLAATLVRGDLGATTVSAALYGAQLAGVPIVITGAIGGVHRGFEETLDVSADLEELSRSRAAVVCTGAKIILDIPRTLEFLETKGVPVLGLRTKDFPAYFCASGREVDACFEEPADIAAVMATHWALGMDCGLVVAVAPPPDLVIEPEIIEKHVEEALAGAARDGIAGKAITPYLLRRLEEATSGLSDRIRRASILRVAEAAADIAVAYARLADRRVTMVDGGRA